MQPETEATPTTAPDDVSAYRVLLPLSIEDARTLLRVLERSPWIERETRAATGRIYSALAEIFDAA